MSLSFPMDSHVLINNIISLSTNLMFPRDKNAFWNQPN